MKRFAALALLVAWFATPVFAQHGGGGHGGGAHFGGGGFAGHAGGAFHGGSPGFRGGFSSPHFAAPRAPSHFSRGFSAARPYHFAGTPRYARPYARSPYSRSRAGYGSGFRARRNHGGGGREHRGFDSDRRRDHFRNRFGFGGPIFYPVPDWIGLGPVGCYPDTQVYGDGYDDFGCDDLTPDTDEQTVYNGDDEGQPPAPPPDYEQQAQPDYEQQAPPDYGQQPRPEYAPPQPPPDPPVRTPHSAPLAANEIATTIVFNDGRPSEQIHNYALTRTTLFVLDQRRSDIPLDQINLAATEKVNRAAGIDFRVPR